MVSVELYMGCDSVRWKSSGVNWGSRGSARVSHSPPIRNSCARVFGLRDSSFLFDFSLVLVGGSLDCEVDVFGSWYREVWLKCDSINGRSQG